MQRQTTGPNDASITENRDGSEEQHFSSKKLLTSMLRYFEKDPNWKEECDWEALMIGDDEPTTTWDIS